MDTNSKYIDFFKSNRADFVRGLSALEGILPTLDETEKLLNGVKISRFDAFDTKVLSNIIQAWGLVLNSTEPANNENALQFYKDLQRTLADDCTESDLETAYVGRFRETGVEVRVRSYFPPTFNTSREAEGHFLGYFEGVSKSP